MEGAEKQVNISSSVQKAVAATIGSAGAVEATAFDEARAEVYNLMKRDTLPRFIATARFDELLASLGEPTPVPVCEPPASLAAARTAFAAHEEEGLGGTGPVKTGAGHGQEYGTNYPS